MKTVINFFIVLISLVFLSFSANAQKINTAYENQTVYTSDVTLKVGQKIDTYEGIISFQWTRDNKSAVSKDTVAMYGSNNYTDWYWVAGTTATTETTYHLYQTPPKFMYYELVIHQIGGSSTTTDFDNIVEIYKK